MQPLSAKVDELLLECAWSLWTELGVKGTQRLHSDCIVALEELIVLTVLLASIDPRLRDEALDWCTRNHHFVSISRLKALVKRFGEAVGTPFSFFAATLNATSRTHWPLFSVVDALKFSPSGKSSAPQCARGALLNLRLRALFGAGARADLLTYFITQDKNSLTAADATETGYSKRSLAEILDSFIQSGLFQVNMKRNQQIYSFVKKEQMKGIIGAIPKVTPPWNQILEVILPLRTILSQIENKSLELRVIEIRKLLSMLQETLARFQLTPPPFNADLSVYWDAFIDWLFKSLPLLLSLK